MPTLTRGSFATAGSSLDFNTGCWRVSRPQHRSRMAPCAFACPAGESPREYLADVADGDPRAAWEKLVAANPLPAITGRVCHHPCEAGCNRGRYDEPIAIHSVERFLGDRAIEENWSYPIQPPGAGPAEIAIVGAGPAGVSAAYHLLRRGFRATVFDSQPEAGGLLRSALPPYRLPRAVLDRELERVFATGIAFQPETRVGRDVSLSELRQDFRAVFLAPGAGRARSWTADGVAPGDPRRGLDLLKEWISIGDISAHGRIAIVGGGNTAIDLARVMKLSGAAEVHVITFQAMPGEGATPPDVMSAVAREIRQALEEGVVIHDHRGIRRLIMRGDTVVGAEMVHMKELEGPGGTPRLVSFEGTETVLKLDQVIAAVGQDVDAAGFESILGRDAFFSPDYWGRLAGHAEVFAGGDARGGGGTVSRAIGDGRRAALAIEAYLEATAPAPETTGPPLAYGELNLSYFDHARRAEAPILEAGNRSLTAEIEGSIAHDGAHAEATRCFSCGECMACDNCWTLCPDNAVLKAEQPGTRKWRYVFDYDHCKGCGICAHECPVGYVAMVDEA